MTNPQAELFPVDDAELERALQERSDALWRQLGDIDRRYAAERAPFAAELVEVSDQLDEIYQRRHRTP
jgi:hypothetical protein